MTMYETEELLIRIPRFTRDRKLVKSRLNDGRHLSDYIATSQSKDTLYYINRTGSKLFVMSRDGTINILPEASGDPTYGLTVVKEKTVKSEWQNVMFDDRTLLVKKPRSQEAVETQTSVFYWKNKRNKTTESIALLLEYYIDWNTLLDNKWGIYIAELDLFVGVVRDDVSFDEITHPYSEVAESLYLRENFKQVKPELDGIVPFGFLIVNHDNKYAPRYMRIGNNVYKVPMTANPEMAEGFHISTPRKYEEQSDIMFYDHRVISMKEADEEFKLTRTYEEALIQEYTIQNEAKFEDIKLRNRQTDYQNKRLSFEEDNLRVSQEMEELRRSNNQLEHMYRSEMRDYTRRREQRLEWLDIAKTTVGIISTLFLLTKAFK